MPIGLYDIRDREPVYTPAEIEAGRQQCAREGLDYITGPNGAAIPLAVFIERMNHRWRRAVLTGHQFRALQSGYCTIEAKGAPEPSRATH